MAGILSGLEAFGLGKLSKMEVYEKEEGQEKKGSQQEAVHHTVSEAELIFDKTYTCPVCDKIFKAKNVKAGNEEATAWGCDLSYDYVKINADYRS